MDPDFGLMRSSMDPDFPVQNAEHISSFRMDVSVRCVTPPPRARRADPTVTWAPLRHAKKSGPARKVAFVLDGVDFCALVQPEDSHRFLFVRDVLRALNLTNAHVYDEDARELGHDEVLRDEHTRLTVETDKSRL